MANLRLGELLCIVAYNVDFAVVHRHNTHQTAIKKPNWR